MNHLNQIRCKLSELILSNKTAENNSTKDKIISIHNAFLEEKYPGISLEIKNKIRKLLITKQTEGLDLDNYLEVKFSESPETILFSFLKEIDMDFSHLNFDENINNIPDIPQQAKEANQNNVPSEYNGTIWVLKNSQWNIVANPKIVKILQENFWLDSNQQKDINNILEYAPGAWLEIFRQTMELLIQFEEKHYEWPKAKACISRPFLIPGWAWWLTLFRDFFLSEWELVIVPNYRWPNIDWIVVNKTKVPVCEARMINETWNIELQDLDNILSTALLQKRKKVSIYLNSPNNPTGTRFSENDAQKLNNLLETYPELKIQIVLDDPYWALSINTNWFVTAPLSYYINTQDNPHISLIELWSHGTKEAWIYGLRTAILRVFTNQDKLWHMEKFISDAIRKTWSMSNTLSQVILTKAILWKDIDVFDNNSINNAWNESIQNEIWEYIDARDEMLDVIYPKLQHFKESIMNQCSQYLIPMENTVDNINELWWFFLCFSLSDSAKELWLVANNLRKKCIWMAEEDKCGLSVFNDNQTGNQVIRISLISWDIEEFSRRLKKWIAEWIKDLDSY